MFFNCPDSKIFHWYEKNKHFTIFFSLSKTLTKCSYSVYITTLDSMIERNNKTSKYTNVYNEKTPCSTHSSTGFFSLCLAKNAAWHIVTSSFFCVFTLWHSEYTHLWSQCSNTSKIPAETTTKQNSIRDCWKYPNHFSINSFLCSLAIILHAFAICLATAYTQQAQTQRLLTHSLPNRNSN